LQRVKQFESHQLWQASQGELVGGDPRRLVGYPRAQLLSRERSAASPPL
jgi:hypothetical protein